MKHGSAVPDSRASGDLFLLYRSSLNHLKLALELMKPLGVPIQFVL